MGAELKDKVNPNAERWMGRDHFFQPKQEAPQLSEGVLMHQFHEAIEELSGKNSKPGSGG